MSHDPSKMIDVAYNHLNLPRQIDFGPQDNIQFAYTATGAKLRKTVTTQKTTSGSVTDYCGNFIYADNQLITIFAGDVRVAPVNVGNSTYWKYEYSMKDHLGNTRVVFAAHSHGQPELLQQTSYYPFGMTMQQQNFYSQNATENKYLYNSKELQDNQLAGNTLDWYDYGARFYDATLGRWHVVDPHAENYLPVSPYAYVANNPMIFIDPDGRDIIIWYKENGEQKSFRFIGSTQNLPNNQFVAQVVQAWTFNVGNGGGDPSFEAATNREIEINIIQHDQFSVHSEGNIYWNPDLGLNTDNALLSPSTILDHELDHAVAFSKNPFEFRKNAREGTHSKFGSLEEARVITGSEQKTALANNEIGEGQYTRTNYGSGHHVVTKSVVSNQVDKAATYQFYKRIEHTGRNVTKYLLLYE
jgi:RHS repeat-associated protein